MTGREPEYAERLYTSSLHKAAENAPDNHRKGSCLAWAFRTSLYGVALLLAVGSLISWLAS